MNLIHKHLTIENDTIMLEELKHFRGKNVELLVIEETLQNKKKENGNINSFFALAGKIDFNETAFRQLRSDSLL